MFEKTKAKVDKYLEEHPVASTVIMAIGSLGLVGFVGYKVGSDLTEIKIRNEYHEKEGQRILKILQDSIPKED